MAEKDSDKEGMSNPDVEEHGGGEEITESSKQEQKTTNRYRGKSRGQGRTHYRENREDYYAGFGGNRRYYNYHTTNQQYEGHWQYHRGGQKHEGRSYVGGRGHHYHKKQELCPDQPNDGRGVGKTKEESAVKEKDSKTTLFTPVVKENSSFCYEEQKQKSGPVVQKYVSKDKQGSTSKNPKTGVANVRRSREGKRVVPTAQSNELSQELVAGTYECMVCCDRIKARHEIWGCPCCYNLFHLRCIGRWARSPAAAVNEDNCEEGWRCPGCQNSSKVVPSVYKCFCGHVSNPGDRRGRGSMMVPHSCGEPCLKKLALSSSSSNCHHKCHQLCHPGPCPPCPVTVVRHCPCRKTSSRVRCSQYGTLPSCGGVCGRKLDCTLHICKQLCHEGPCQSCDVSTEVPCYCERESKVFKCGELLNNEVGGASRNGYSCQRMCNRNLSCGNHTCELSCHHGNCPPCPLLPSAITHCPCGSTPISELLPEGVVRTSCLDEVPTCKAQCLKPHPCGNEDSSHLCMSRCHVGDCPPCTSTSLAECRCGRSTVKVSCQEVVERTGFECNRVCRKQLSCGRHKCQSKCCVSDVHECTRICGRKFTCGLHTCPDVCHPGGCGPCWNISYEELTCHCGGEVMLPPIPCGSRPPACSRPCARPHPCEHPVTHSCHSDESCPQCTFLTERMCVGEHTIRKNIPCYMREVTCGMACGKPLPCGMHTCRKTCHKGVCLKEGEICKQPCSHERKYCTHSCSATCHPGDPCPDTPCKAKVTLKCHCGYRSENAMCLASSSEVMSQAFHKLHHQDLGAMLREVQSGQSVRIANVSLENLKERRLDCDEECAKYERNRRLAEALELSNVDYSPDSAPEYSLYLLDQARENPQFVSNLEAIFKQIVENAQSSQQPARHTFKPMRKELRRMIHELASYYGCKTCSYDLDPLRNVVAMATKNSSLPSISLSRAAEINRHKPMPPPALARPRPIPNPTGLVLDQRSHFSGTPDYFSDDL